MSVQELAAKLDAQNQAMRVRIQEVESALWKAEAAAEEARQETLELADVSERAALGMWETIYRLEHDLAEARQELQRYVVAVPEWAERDKARIRKLEAALQKAENFIEKVVWETGYGGVLLEGIRAALQPTTEAAQEEENTVSAQEWNKAAAHAGFAGSEFVDDPAAVFAALARQREGDAILRRQLAEARQERDAALKERDFHRNIQRGVYGYEVTDWVTEVAKLTARIEELEAALRELPKGIDFNPTLGMDGGDVDRLYQFIGNIGSILNERIRAALHVGGEPGEGSRDPTGCA